MYLHRQLGMQVSSCSETVNNPYTYTCVDLYMASPLEKKSRELEVLISHRIWTALCYGSCWTMSCYQGGEESQGLGLGWLHTEEKGFKLGGDLTVPIEWKNRQAFTVTSSNELRSSGCKPSSPRLLWLSCDLILRPNFDDVSGSMMKCFIFIPLGVHFCSCGRQHKCWTAFHPFFCLSVSQGFHSALKCTVGYYLTWMWVHLTPRKLR